VLADFAFCEADLSLAECLDSGTQNEIVDVPALWACCDHSAYGNSDECRIINDACQAVVGDYELCEADLSLQDCLDGRPTNEAVDTNLLRVCCDSGGVADGAICGGLASSCQAHFEDFQLCESDVSVADCLDTGDNNELANALAVHGCCESSPVRGDMTCQLIATECEQALDDFELCESDVSIEACLDTSAANDLVDAHLVRGCCQKGSLGDSISCTAITLACEPALLDFDLCQADLGAEACLAEGPQNEVTNPTLVRACCADEPYADTETCASVVTAGGV